MEQTAGLLKTLLDMSLLRLTLTLPVDFYEKKECIRKCNKNVRDPGLG